SNTMPYFRQESNGNTIRILIGDASAKFWMYRNSTSPGFVIDATVTDRVLAFKGGTAAYNVNGGNQAGTWTQPGHTLSAGEMPAHTHTYNQPYMSGGSYDYNAGANWGPSGTSTGSAGSGGSHSHGTTYRPYAAVGTLQYPDI
ncbi:MAG: hypothetical protein ABIH25_04550, partial [Candidatus Woesearchaeota archaeon]